jgi:hypothetical protein
VTLYRRVIIWTRRPSDGGFVDAGEAERVLLRQARDHDQGEMLSALAFEGLED